MNPPKVEITPFQQMAASCSGAIMTSIMVTPLDVVKIRLQKQVKQKGVAGYNGGGSCHVEKKGFLSSSLLCKTYCERSKKSVTPLDVVKIRLQSQRRPMSAGSCFIYCNGLMDHICTCPKFAVEAKDAKSTLWYTRPGRFNGTFDAMIKIARNEGLPSLWSGLPPTLVMAVPATVCYFTLYDNILATLRRKYGRKIWLPMVAGGSARVVAVTIISPLEMIRTKMQSEKLNYSEIVKAIKITTSNRGLLSLWTGLGPTLLRDVPFSVLYWSFYESFKGSYLAQTTASYLTFLPSFLFGAMSGSLAAIVTCPFDVIKTHRQIELGELEAVKNYKTKPTSTWILLGRLYQQQGVQALFAGLVPRLIKVAPACAIMIGTYEYLKTLFSEMNRQKRSI